VTEPATDPTAPQAASAPEVEAVLEMDDAELERLEADLAAIEAAMDRVDAGDLDGATTLMARLGDEDGDLSGGDGS
tara:strand:- start:1115 stop:1342 length:228 start_codon:yes stop_codon:yes gene_type:complete